jgi:hypothetical protein
MQNETKLIVVISDLHCGSSVGLIPPVFDELDDGPALTQNAPQQWLWKQWRDFWDRWIPSVTGDDAWSLVINGDATEGVHHRSVQVHPDEIVHWRIANHVLAPLVPMAHRMFMVRGTECHTGNMETDLAYRLGCEQSPDGRWAHDHLRLEVNGVGVSFQHHIGASARPWLGGYQMLASLVEEQFRASSRGQSPPGVIVRSHRHVFGSMTTSHGACVVTPAWQLLTRYGKKVTQDMLAMVGGIVLDFRDREPGELPLIHHKLYSQDATEALTP